ncbi:MAG: YbgA family protein, partial [bacterium]
SAQASAHTPIYEAKLMRALKTLATVPKHTNILQHMAGYLRGKADDADRQELADIIAQYHEGLTPLIVPVTMLRHYVTKYDIQYLNDQYYLAPHPMELKLRNHA